MGRMAFLKSRLEQLFTGYFAAVMATGIVSIALFLNGHVRLSNALFDIATTIYAVLIVLYVARCAWFPRRVWSDLTNAARVNGYFTFIAGTDVLGMRFALGGHAGATVWFGIVGVTAWLLLTYFTMMFMIFYNQQTVDKVMNGSWLIVTVSTESVTTVATVLSDAYSSQASWLLLTGTVFWAIGIVIYFLFMGFILYRLFFYPTRPMDLGPPNWINMGAMAISTLAGARLILSAGHSTLLIETKPFLEGTTLVLWAWGTWWIPLLILIGIWKYGVHREPVRYEPSLWSMVFPLGMYTAATDTLSKVDGLHLLHELVSPGMWIALAAWTAVGVGYLWSWRGALAARSATGADNLSHGA
ncbi:MAG: tellurite resistance/C4-dicarboxylate transporter family protein [Alicyclobacillus macrosporangiidus]|uniref:tellurite resistance/C4-dicarboxylate transporter family protein n=1 Tax=Alicyclobacillus macrosporangiidus TaxID=392015 RepID=UPI0026EA3014|nr:tellurite resistance/C4-dicarboxylate transporter family protein [Alicyclobacillus macrosporangiidus]MCL6597383.1 tellurite resistance/C4-dicarboxylate transporter family protein [Alicyclobacillus macrosporangiidus]